MQIRDSTLHGWMFPQTCQPSSSYGIDSWFPLDRGEHLSPDSPMNSWVPKPSFIVMCSWVVPIEGLAVCFNIHPPSPLYILLSHGLKGERLGVRLRGNKILIKSNHVQEGCNRSPVTINKCTVLLILSIYIAVYKHLTTPVNRQQDLQILWLHA